MEGANCPLPRCEYGQLVSRSDRQAHYYVDDRMKSCSVSSALGTKDILCGYIESITAFEDAWGLSILQRLWKEWNMHGNIVCDSPGSITAVQIK